MGMSTVELVTHCTENGTKWESGRLAIPDQGARVMAQRPLCGHEDCELEKVASYVGERTVNWADLQVTIGPLIVD